MADGTETRPEHPADKPETPGKPEKSSPGKPHAGNRGCLAGTFAALVLAWMALRVAPWVHAHHDALVILALGTAGLCVGAWLLRRSWEESRARRSFEEEHGSHLAKLPEELERMEREVADWERAVEDLERAAESAEREGKP